jgi:hypothetical protein
LVYCLPVLNINTSIWTKLKFCGGWKTGFLCCAWNICACLSVQNAQWLLVGVSF